ncbi:hypothetical protein KR009_001176 [Drosophila setifemur]|nr:hypothetical protein KR009_001176 [Drosophila setifemur]
MAPTKARTRASVVQNQQAANPLLGTRKGLTRRTVGNNANIDPNAENFQTTRGKRKADHSPIKNDNIDKKRSALGNLTNNVKIMHAAGQQQEEEAVAAGRKPKPTAQQLQALLDAKNQENLTINVFAAATAPTNAKMVTRASSKTDDTVENCHRVLDKIEETMARPRSRPKALPPKKNALGDMPLQMPVLLPPMPMQSLAAPQMAVPKTVRRISNDFNKTEDSLYMSALQDVSSCDSNDFNKTEDSLYMSALQDVSSCDSNDFNKTEDTVYMSALEDVSSCDSMRLSGNFEAARRRSAKLQQKTEQQPPQLVLPAADSSQVVAIKPVPLDVEDFDRKNWDDPFQVSHYAMDIFNYLKSREPEFPIADYMPRQIHLTTWKRTLLIDWMVQVQETFELNHETLYLAVKIVDLYLCREVINKEKLQLLGAAAFIIACKYDESQPPLIKAFLYLYNHDELVAMEREALRTINFDLGIPLSYRFLRRYARCAKVPMPTLTLAEYILELSLMDYATIAFSDSKMASAALFMALRMDGGHGQLDKQTWSSTLVYYTGLELAEFGGIVPVLNAGLHRRSRATIRTIRNKYSQKIFYEVAKVPLLSNQELFQTHDPLKTPP